MGVDVAPDHDGRPLGDPEIALPERDAIPLGEADELLDRLVHEPGVGGVRHRLGLDRRIDRDPLEVLGRERSGRVRYPQALLDQRGEPLRA